MAENLNAISAKLGHAHAPVATPPIVVPISGVLATVKLLDLSAGLYAVTIDAAHAQMSLGGMNLPATSVTPLANDPQTAAEVFGAESGASWVGPAGGTVVLRIPAGGGRSLITTYRSEQQEATPLSIKIAAIGRAAAAPSPHPSNGASLQSSRPSEPPTLPAQITFCIDQVSEQAPAGGWAGVPGSKRFLEAFGITAQGDIETDGIEYKAFGPNGRETPWVSSGKLCGSRGKKSALTGFAIRPAAHWREKIDVIYTGAFAGSGQSGPCRNGEACRAKRSDDPLEALSLSIVSRQ